MPRPLRCDLPGRTFHLMVRAVNKRTAFESRHDVRKFLALLACEVRRGRIEIISYSFLTTHAHFVVRSTTGELAKAMHRVLGTYASYFNRTRERGGPLQWGRYKAKPVCTNRYFWVLVRYVDQNAPKARLVSSSVLYPYGSACLYASPRRPKWLSTKQIDAAMGDPAPADRPKAYARRYGLRVTPEEATLIVQRLHHPGDVDDAWDSLIGAATPQVMAWMVAQARVADGSKPGLPLVGAERIRVLVLDLEASVGPWRCRGARDQLRGAWPILMVGLLRDLAGATYAEIARRVDCTPPTAASRVRHHAQLLKTDEVYRARAAELGSRLLAESVDR